jgi:TPR repeat protein
MKRTLLGGLLAVIGLLCISGTWAQSTSAPATSAPAQNPGVDPALLAKATAGDASAQYNLGYAYEKGKGAPQDYAQAADWYEKAALQGYAAAQGALGILYEHNQGIPQDYGEAYFWLDLAAQASPTENKGYSRAEIVSARDEAARHLSKDTLSEVQTQINGFVPSHPNQSSKY